MAVVAIGVGQWLVSVFRADPSGPVSGIELVGDVRTNSTTIVGDGTVVVPPLLGPTASTDHRCADQHDITRAAADGRPARPCPGPARSVATPGPGAPAGVAVLASEHGDDND